MRCPNGHQVVKASQAHRSMLGPDHDFPGDWFFCGECEAISGTCGHSFGKGIFYSPTEIHQNGQAQTAEVQP